MKRVILITGHYLESKRRGSFHWLADAFWQAGWTVLFFTASLSHLSRLRDDHRFQYPVEAEANRIKQVRERLGSFVWLTPWHPANLRVKLLNTLSAPLFRAYGRRPLGAAEAFIQRADLCIFESGAGLMLFERFKALAPASRFVYRVSDDLRVLGTHPVIQETEKRVASAFDLISLPSPLLRRSFPGLTNIRIHPMGMCKASFEAPCENPYGAGEAVDVVSVGTMLFDGSFFRIASKLFPAWRFHVIGKVDDPRAEKNVAIYGEIPFNKTVPYIRFADIGLAPYRYQERAEYLAYTSNKMIQYTFCRLPIVAPHFAVADHRPHAFGYDPGDADSIGQALSAARALDRSVIDAKGIRSWDELAADLSI